MWRINRPAISATRVITDAISTLVDTGLHDRFEGSLAAVESMVGLYDAAAAQGACHSLARADFAVVELSTDELCDLYKNKMVPVGSAARRHYERIQALAPHRKCPLCGHGTVRTLDHVMPKRKYPGIALAPLNLVPACGDCNHKKGSSVAGSAYEETLHPYYDDITERWLFAEISPQGVVHYFVQAPAHWDALLTRRVQAHFETYALNFIYVSQTGGELGSVCQYLRTHMNNQSEASIQVHLRAEASARAVSIHNNSWQHALYDALSLSSWFCGGGFRDIAKPVAKIAS